MQELEFEHGEQKYRSGVSGRSKIGLIAAVAVVAILVAIITPVAYFLTRPDEATPSIILPTPGTTTKPSRPVAERLDCYPESESLLEKVTKEACELRNCVYRSEPEEGGPLCYFPVGGHGYTVKEIKDTGLGFKVKLSQRGKSPFGTVVKELEFEVELRDDHLLRFKVSKRRKCFYLVIH